MNEDEEPKAVLIRFPEALLQELDDYAASVAPKYTKPSRNAVILTILEEKLAAARIKK